jgi:hypothetical protein
MNLAQIKLRVGLLRELARGLGKEVTLWKGTDGPLLAGERRAYLNGLHDALAGLNNAAVVLDAAVRRLEALDLPEATAQPGSPKRTKAAQ